jgi:putative membrane protein
VRALIQFALPWEISPAVILCCVAALVLYIRGIRREVGCGVVRSRWRRASFSTGLTFIYISLQTHLDYLAQHTFWIHRLQHLVLHHIGPILVAWSAPWSSIAAGLPATGRAWWGMTVLRRPLQALYRVLQQPLLAGVLFTGLIYFWLWPSVHFRAMLSAADYNWMNWSMVLDGLLFWWLVLDPRSREEGATMSFGARIALVLLVMLPQLLLGAYLCLHNRILYDVYSVCGRLLPISPITDQQIGGLITWIPACMMSVAVTLILWRRWMVNDDRVHLRRTGTQTAMNPIAGKAR